MCNGQLLYSTIYLSAFRKCSLFPTICIVCSCLITANSQDLFSILLYKLHMNFIKHEKITSIVITSLYGKETTLGLAT